MRLIGWAGLVFALLAASCAPLVAEAPLFSPDDLVGGAPIEEGRWTRMTPDCVVLPVASDAVGGCTIFEVTRGGDGFWQIKVSSAGVSEASDNVRAVAVIAPAMDAPRTGNAPVFLAEYMLLDEKEAPGPYYAAIVPVGPQPATEMFLLTQIFCGDVLRDGPVADVVEATEMQPDRCIARTQTAVRTAVRRALIESLPNIDAARLVHVGRSYHESEPGQAPPLVAEYDAPAAQH